MIEVSEMQHGVRPWDQATLDRSWALQERDKREWLRRRKGGDDVKANDDGRRSEQPLPDDAA
jgi:hypothetical protein